MFYRLMDSSGNSSRRGRFRSMCGVRSRHEDRLYERAAGRLDYRTRKIVGKKNKRAFRLVPGGPGVCCCLCTCRVMTGMTTTTATTTTRTTTTMGTGLQ